ncbi:MAG: nuclear transport factor 2 family protein [Sediminibacterium sp.]|nr:nuclear transport factor 2 family protein [Chitinophagaceae bacterium]MCA6447095.1 nuclear transport factor 2 family protein [Chitinophagaceae bacterium]
MTNPINTVPEVLNNYLTAMVQKDASMMPKIFIPAAQMLLIKDGKMLEIPIFPGLIQYIQQTPEDKEAQASILSFDITGNAASGKVQVISKGLIYTDYFNLLLINDQWMIVNKTFSITVVKN